MTLTMTAALILMAPPPPPVHAAPRSALQFRSEFTITVQAPPPEAFELFGAHGERVWAGEDWNPRFLEPVPAQDRSGAVYLMPHGQRTVLGYTTVFDRERWRAQHVFIREAGSATVIDVTLAPLGPGASRVTVSYERTALVPAAEAEVRELAEQDAAQAVEWETQINAWLASKAKAPASAPGQR